MAGNSRRRGAVRKSKKGATAGSGGQSRKGLSGRGPTPRAEDRKGHPAARRAAAAARRGDELTARARVTGNYEKKGHRFVELDALLVGNGRTALAHCQHIAIYQPREQAAA